MRLEELEPKWWAAPGREGQGVVFRCPCCRTVWLCVAFANPVDGGAPWDIGDHQRRPIRQLWELLYGGPGMPGGIIARGELVVPPGFLWTRTGADFAGLTIYPSVDCSPAGHWHGFVTGGLV